jgi:glycerophosphoryl diester phosphodiesterase
VPVVAIAHRGEPVGHRENTLPAFAAAVTEGADMVEIDLRRTRDGTIVVLHDQTLERLWGLPASVGDVTLSEVVGLGKGAVRIPTLTDVLAAVPLPLMVDFTRREVVAGGLQAVEAAGALRRCLFVTGNVAALRQLRAASPEARVGLTWLDGPEPPLALLHELGAEYWNPWFGVLTAEGAHAVHEAGLQVSTWTVDTPEEMTKVLEAGADAVVTNRIGALVAHLGRAERGGD